jgi:hypothetical protein
VHDVETGIASVLDDHPTWCFAGVADEQRANVVRPVDALSRRSAVACASCIPIASPWCSPRTRDVSR